MECVGATRKASNTFVDQGHFFPDQHLLEERLEFDRLLAGMSDGKRALLRRLKEAAEKGGAVVS